MSLRSPSRASSSGDTAGLIDPARSHSSLQRAKGAECWSWWERTLRSTAHHSLSQIAIGELEIHDALGRQIWGASTSDRLRAVVQILDPRAYSSLLFGGSVGAAEAYVHGWWRSDDLTSLVRLLARNGETLQNLNGLFTWLAGWMRYFSHSARSNHLAGSRRNIADHYDLGNDLFHLFLDETMSYSSGLFANRETTLAAAQLAKIDRLCDLLQLGPGDHLLEIGCGWGALAARAASKYGCRVTATTISREQFAFAQERIEALGLTGQVDLLLDDYRELRGTYDKIVSVEMIEAVGYEYLDSYFQQCCRLLRPGGQMALQGITIADRYEAQYRSSVDFIQQYVFPGGYLPSLTSICQSLTRTGDFTVARLDNFPRDYARTLAIWRERFQEQHPALRKLGLSESSLRLWDYYFSYCEGAFLEDQIGLVQMLLTRPGGASHPSRS